MVIMPTGNRAKVWINWEEIVDRDASGMPLFFLTILKLKDDFDAYMLQERTGIRMAKGLVAWNAIITNELQANPETVSWAKLAAWLEKEFKTWESTRSQSAGPAAVTIDPKFAKHADKYLHAILGKHGHKLSIDSLAAFVDARFEADEINLGLDFADLKEQIKAHIKANSDTYDIGLGASPTVAELKDAKGKPTGETPSNKERRSGGTRNVKFTGLLRGSESTKKAFADVGIDYNENALDNWRAYCEHHNIQDPAMRDLIEFAKAP